jgi:hypothetical protein
MEINKNELEALYLTENKTAMEIAHVFGFKSPQSILNKLKQYGIKTRNGRAAQRCMDIDPAILYDLCVVKKYSMQKIAQIVGLNSGETVRRLLVLNGIARLPKTRNFGGNNKGNPLSIEQRMKISETRKSLFATGKLIHWNKGHTCPLEVRLKISDTLLDGREPSPQSYGDDWKLQRTSCLQRDNFTCQQCERNDQLEVHHWVPYRFSFDNSLENLVTLCEDCHHDIHMVYLAEGFITEAEEYYA